MISDGGVWLMKKEKKKIIRPRPTYCLLTVKNTRNRIVILVCAMDCVCKKDPRTD